MGAPEEKGRVEISAIVKKYADELATELVSQFTQRAGMSQARSLNIFECEDYKCDVSFTCTDYKCSGGGFKCNNKFSISKEFIGGSVIG